MFGNCSAPQLAAQAGYVASGKPRCERRAFQARDILNTRMHDKQAEGYGIEHDTLLAYVSQSLYLEVLSVVRVARV